MKRLSRDMVNTKGMSSLSTYEFSILKITFPLNLIKEKLTEFIEPTFNLACKQKHTFSLLNNIKDIICGHVRKCVRLSIILLDNIFLRFVSKLYRHIVGFPMGTNCVPLAADFEFVLLV